MKLKKASKSIKTTTKVKHVDKKRLLKTFGLLLALILVVALGLFLIQQYNSTYPAEGIAGKAYSDLSPEQKQGYWACYKEKGCGALLTEAQKSKNYAVYRTCSKDCHAQALAQKPEDFYCTDSDGINYTNKGKVTTNFEPKGKEDYCLEINGKNYLFEGRCVNNKAQWVQKNCKEMGYGSVCKESRCLVSGLSTQLENTWYTGIVVYQFVNSGEESGYYVINEVKNKSYDFFVSKSPGVGYNSFKDIQDENEDITYFLESIDLQYLPNFQKELSPLEIVKIVNKFKKWYLENKLDFATPEQIEFLSPQNYSIYASFFKQNNKIYLIHCGFSSWFVAETLVRLGVPRDKVLIAGGFYGNPLDMPKDKPLVWSEGLLESAPAHYYNLVRVGDQWLVIDFLSADKIKTVSDSKKIIFDYGNDKIDYMHPYGVRMIPKVGKYDNQDVLGVPLAAKEAFYD